MAQFHETRMGQRFFESDVPGIADSLKRIANALNAPKQAPSIDPQALVQDIVNAFETQLVSQNGRNLRHLLEAMGPNRLDDQNDIWREIRKLVASTARNVAQALAAEVE